MRDKEHGIPLRKAARNLHKRQCWQSNFASLTGVYCNYNTFNKTEKDNDRWVNICRRMHTHAHTHTPVMDANLPTSTFPTDRTLNFRLFHIGSEYLNFCWRYCVGGGCRGRRFWSMYLRNIAVLAVLYMRIISDKLFSLYARKTPPGWVGSRDWIESRQIWNDVYTHMMRRPPQLLRCIHIIRNVRIFWCCLGAVGLKSIRTDEK